MNVSDSSRYRCPGASKARVRPRPDDTRSASPTGRAILLLLVGTAHLAGLWALSQTERVTAIVLPEPLTVTMIELAQASAPPDAVAPMPTPTSSRQQATPRMIESQPRTVAPVRPPQPSEHAPRISAENPAAEAVEESTPISPPQDATPSSVEAPPPQRSPAPAAAVPAEPNQPRFDAAYLDNPAPAILRWRAGWAKRAPSGSACGSPAKDVPARSSCHKAQGLHALIERPSKPFLAGASSRHASAASPSTNG